MRISVEEIGDEGLDLQEPLSRSWIDSVLGSDRPALFSALGPAELSAHLEKFDEGVLLRAESHLRLTTSCRRCLRPVELIVPISFSLSLVPRKSLARRQGTEDDGTAAAKGEPRSCGSFDPRDVDQETFDGRAIELAPLVREQLLLALPMDAVCQAGCKGLCPSCGQDLNERSCGCKVEPPDPRWESLRSLKLSN
ncbi:MAG: YceD family protein [Myxococcales bacterium]